MNTTYSLFIITLINILSIACAHAVEPRSITEMLGERAMSMIDSSDVSSDDRLQSCNSDATGVVTIYTTTGKAQVGIDVSIDGQPVGSLTSHYPDDEPACNTDSSDGVITIVVPEGDHTLDAESLNLFWPTYTFKVRKCDCLSLPLS